MKKILLTLLLLTGLRASAFDWTYSTNLFWTITTPTNIFCGTNSTDPARDSYIVIWNKLNADINLMWQRILTATNGGSGGGITNLIFTNTVTLPAGSPATVTNVGIVGSIAYYQISVPMGSNGPAGAGNTNTFNFTNTITAYNFTNMVLDNQQIVYTNIYPLNFTGSNYIGRFPMVDTFQLHVPLIGGGGGGLDMPSLQVEQVWLSLTKTNWTGTNGWFKATNASPQIYTNCAVAVVGVVGGSGSIEVDGCTHPELVGRSYSLYRETIFAGNPVNSGDVVNLGYLNAVLQGFQQPWNTGTDTNYFKHIYATINGVNIFDISGRLAYLTVDSITVVGTNIVLTVNQTNMAASFQFQQTTNLLLPFVPVPSYTQTTNSGVVSFTVPMPSSFGWFRMVLPTLAAVTVNAPITFNVTTNQITWGATNTAPANTSTPVGWISVQVFGRTNAYRMPIYQ